MNETSKAAARRARDPRYMTRWLVGDGIDIGCGPDPLKVERGTVRPWDVPDGDAQYMEGVPDDHYDFVHSSHCLEHMENATIALANWVRICRPGGHLVIMVPDEDLYEQGIFPSTFNSDHKWTFTINKSNDDIHWKESWCRQSLNIVDLLSPVAATILKIELLDEHFDYNGPRRDQTLGASESAIEFVLRKR